jgi:hypothetical protein
MSNETTDIVSTEDISIWTDETDSVYVNWVEVASLCSFWIKTISLVSSQPSRRRRRSSAVSNTSLRIARMLSLTILAIMAMLIASGLIGSLLSEVLSRHG